MSDNMKQEIIQAASMVDLCPVPIEREEIVTIENRKISFEDIGALGGDFGLVISSLSTFFVKKEGIYKVTLPAGGHLAAAKDGTGYLGTVLNDSTNKIMAQARLEDAAELACDPAMLFMAAALMSIEVKLDEIKETQEEILDILIQKEKAKLRGSLKFLTDTISDYRFNWNNEQYKNANYVKALDIRQQAEQSILLAQNQIKKQLSKKELINTDQSVAKKISKLKSNMEDYQLSVYLLGLSYYAEILLQGNFDENYLQSITDKIDKYSVEYRVIYTQVYENLSDSKESAIQGVLLKGLGKAGKGIGNAVGKVPLLNKGPVDEALKKAGKVVSKQRDKAEKKDLAGLLPQRTCNVKPFVDTLDMINQLYNKPVELAFDEDSLYVLENNKSKTV